MELMYLLLAFFEQIVKKLFLNKEIIIVDYGVRG